MQTNTYQPYSILMSVYGKEKPEYLRESIESMLHQSVPAEQFVIVEDGALPDSLKDILEEYGNTYPTVFTIVRLGSNLGLGIALDCGLSHCRNDLVARMDSDDISLPDRCEKQLRVFKENPALDIVSGTIAEFKDSRENIVSRRVVPETQEAIKKQMRTRSAFNHPAVMYRKSKVLDCGGYEAFYRKQDHILFSRMLNKGCNAYNMRDVLVYVRADENQFRRKKSWLNCKSYIIAEWILLRRKECSFFDFLYVVAAQGFFFITPIQIIEYVTKKYLRD